MTSAPSPCGAALSSMTGTSRRNARPLHSPRALRRAVRLADIRLIAIARGPQDCADRLQHSVRHLHLVGGLFDQPHGIGLVADHRRTRHWRRHPQHCGNQCRIGATPSARHARHYRRHGAHRRSARRLAAAAFVPRHGWLIPFEIGGCADHLRDHRCRTRLPESIKFMTLQRATAPKMEKAPTAPSAPTSRCRRTRGS